MADPLRIALEEPRPAFAPRARWVLEVFAEGLGRTARFGDRAGADLVYSPTAPAQGVWIPAEHDAQAFFEGTAPFPGSRAHVARGLTLLFPPSHPERAVPGDIVASAFYLLARWDELRVTIRDRFGRLPLAASAFAAIDGLALEEPPVEGYLARLRDLLGVVPPAGWSVGLTHDIDRIRRRTVRGVAGLARRRRVGDLGRLALHDPWDNLTDLLWTSLRRGVAPTVFLIGRNRHRLDGSPRRTYERERRRWAAAVAAAGGEVGLHASFASSDEESALARELDVLRREAGPIHGVRFHYLRFRYHESVARLERLGLDYDASLGFSEAPGFACGIARSFRPYLVGPERPAALRLVPLVVMDTTLHRQLGLDAVQAEQRTLDVMDVVRRYGGDVSLLWHNTYLADERAPDYGALWERLLDELAARGAALGPLRPPPAPTGARLDGRRVLHLTSVHRGTDVRILHKEATAAQRAGADARVLARAPRGGRARRVLGAGALLRTARRRNADIYHVHDPELLPGALWLARATRRPVVYDVHEYLGETTRAKRWIPTPLRRPAAVLAARAERALGRHLAGIVTVTEDLAARFTMAGADHVAVVTNAPWRIDYPVPAPFPEAPTVLYVGGLGPLRGLPLMLAAFPSVRAQVPNARLVLAGPGEVGELPPGVEHLGRVEPREIPALLADASIAWVPLQHHGNYERAIATKMMEAMAAGRPVVVSDLGRMRALVRQSECGVVVAPDDAEAHAAAIVNLLVDPAQAARLGANGRAAFERSLTYERQADALTRLYEAILRDDVRATAPWRSRRGA